MRKGLLVLAAVVMALAPMSDSAALVRGGVVVYGGGRYGPGVGNVLGLLGAVSLLCLAELGSSETGHEGERRAGVHQRVVRRHDPRE
jgi:hypothetical protein